MAATRVRGAAGVELAVHLQGDTDAAPVVLLHALGETAETWRGLVAELAPTHRTAAFDLRGHGASDWPGRYPLDLMRDDVIAAAENLGFERFMVVGHSLGGAVALLVAQQLGERVERLVIEDAVPPYPRQSPSSPQRPDGPVPFDWPVAESVHRQITNPDMRQWPALSRITAPTLVVAGGATSHVPGALIAEMAARIPDCTVVTIDVGHEVHRAAPAEFTDAVLGWLSRCR